MLTNRICFAIQIKNFNEITETALFPPPFPFVYSKNSSKLQYKIHKISFRSIISTLRNSVEYVIS